MEEPSRATSVLTPVIRELSVGAHTPLSVYQRLAQGPGSCLLESLEGGKRWARYSIIGLPAETFITVDKGKLTVRRSGAVAEEQHWEDPLAGLRALCARYRYQDAAIPELPAFHGGLAGYFAYDILRYAEPRLAHTAPADHPLGTPDIALMLVEELAVIDRETRTLKLIVHKNSEEEGAEVRAQARLEEMAQRLAEPLPELPPLSLAAADGAGIEAQAQCGFGRERYEAAVARIREYILAGDVMQVVPSRRLSLPFSAEPLNFYRALRELNPSPYMYFLDFGDFHIIGSSPEILARLRDGEVTTRPIAGTRRRGRDEEEDKALEQELLANPKELAEHLMLIDLGRNDVGRIAEIGSVRLTERMVVERYSHVMHIVSTVTGRLSPGLDAFDVLRATLPAGTLSGAPKIRAMEIIDELEPVRRSMYGGAVGYISWRGSMDTAVAIRTVVIKDSTLYIQAGGGIVADSKPTAEWEETCSKARAMLRAAAVVRDMQGNGPCS